MRRLGPAGLVRAARDVVTREQAALLRLALACGAWAVGQTLTYGLALGTVGILVPVVLAVGVFAFTEDLGRPRDSGGNVRYWRGRRLDDDERGRWN